MISIIDAWDEWTESFRARHSCKKPLEDSRNDETGEQTLNSTIPSTKGKLVYWGFSYGVS
jgi:hypothetical protein